MSPAVLYFASGESLYPGATGLFLVVASSLFLKRRFLILRYCLAWACLAMMVMASAPVSSLAALVFIVAFVIWIAFDRYDVLRPHLKILQVSTAVILLSILLIVCVRELSLRRMPLITGARSDHLVVIGDSISSGIGPSSAAWPAIFQQRT